MIEKARLIRGLIRKDKYTPETAALLETIYSLKKEDLTVFDEKADLKPVDESKVFTHTSLPNHEKNPGEATYGM